jgi:hypothetical protein
MIRRLLRGVAPFVLALCGVLPVAMADDPASNKDLHPNAGSGLFGPAPQPAPADPADKAEKPAPTFQVFMAVAAAIIVLCILCAPSRKAESSTARR